MSINPQELQAILDELERSRASRRRAWQNLQELRWVLKETAGIELPPPERKTIDAEGRLVKDGVRKALRERQVALSDLVHAIKEYRTLAEAQPLTLQGSEYARAVKELDEAINRAEGWFNSDSFVLRKSYRQSRLKKV
jgi:DNA repair ATPase RecN